MLFVTGFSVWLSGMTLSVRTLFSQADPADAARELRRPGFLLCWGIGTLLVVCGFRLIARKKGPAIALGLCLIVVSFPIFVLPNIITFFELLNGV
jgi:hypothetical protein